VPSLSCFFAIHTEGSQLNLELNEPKGTVLSLEPCQLLVMPDDEVFGPFAAAFKNARHGPAVLLSLTTDQLGHPERFFAEAHRLVRKVTYGHRGWALDVLKLWPAPLDRAAEAFSDEPFADDLFTVAFRGGGHQRVRAETLGLSKLGHRELSLEYEGDELNHDALNLCVHFAEFLMERTSPLPERAAMSYGFDRIRLEPLDGGGDGVFRGWHPPLIQRLLPPARFSGTGVATVMPVSRPGETEIGLTETLRRARQQRLVLEAHGLDAESPHQDDTALACACVGTADTFIGNRVEPDGPRDSGWTWTCANKHGTPELGHSTLAALVGRFPVLLKYLALPPGSVVSLKGSEATLDVPRPLDPDDEDSQG
jgi:hypothetical protein